MKKIVIDPLTRISGLLEIQVTIENNKIVDAKSGGMQFRGFEKMFQGRPPLDMVMLTSRVCGICSTHHALASSKALEDALNIIPNKNGDYIRKVTNGFEFLQNHLRQFYQFSFPDYVDLGDLSPLKKHEDKETTDYRLPKDINDKVASHYEESLKHSRNAHKAIAILAGKAPHTHGVFVGGTTTNLDIEKYQQVKVILSNIKNFIENTLLSDIDIIAKYYPEYFYIGKGHGNLMCTELFYDEEIPVKYVKGGVIINNKFEEENFKNVREDYKYTWLSANDDTIRPISNPPELDENKNGAYSWVAAARYKNYPMEVGPLARMTISGFYKNGISTMDRVIARALEAQKICQCIESLLEYVRLEPAYQRHYEIPESAIGQSATEASRGTLLHFIEIENKVVKNYNLIPPTVWNLSPKDNNSVRGPVEEALVGTEIENINKATTIIGRIVRSFDPCLSCAAHITSDRHSPVSMRVI